MNMNTRSCLSTETPYPHYPDRNVTVLDGLWDFTFLGESIDPDTIDISSITYNDIFCVPGVFDTTPAYAGRRGTALYRRQVTTSPNTRLKLKIGGLGLWARIYWDGTIVGADDLPYSGMDFEFEAGSGCSHELVILVDNRLDYKRCALFYQYYDFYGFGGIYRSIELHELPALNLERARITPLDIKTGLVAIDLELAGALPARLPFTIAFDHGKETAYCEPVTNGRVTLKVKVPRFKLWSPRKPHLHAVTIRTPDDGLTERFGLRTITTSKGKILLNGKALKLLGYCRHESHMDFGPVQPLPLLIQDLQYLKDLGCNFVRGTHYPQDQRFLDLCDQLGFLVWEESLGWGNKAEHFANPAFFDAQIRQTRLMVRNSHNHPAVIIWGFLNEGKSDLETSREMYSALFKTIRDLDSSRLVTYASNRAERDLFFDQCDVISLNTYPGWYAADTEKTRPLDEIVPRLNAFIKHIDTGALKNKPFIISEIGAGAIYGWHDRFRAMWSEEYQAEYLDIVTRYVAKTPRVAGLSIWHFADARTYTSSYALGRPRTINDKGTLDEYRRPKLAYEVVKKRFNP